MYWTSSPEHVTEAPGSTGIGVGGTVVCEYATAEPTMDSDATATVATVVTAQRRLFLADMSFLS